MEKPIEVWAVCGAPAKGCGGGRRRRRLVTLSEVTKTPWCPDCGSEMRVCKVQKPLSR